ncbi:hypothetical protein [Histidinibacterium aquaticum]|uniref:Uncharacterized protein n=1 Tax=Histidinibacterium aquaticum TaxID=2613962 RepID=A0A5J5GDB3_9RHOB|nr:hypothetical protein [Histidinibacterium aquaticum]KAA9005940.1 hypothetical protein F3S47_15385 [Histidinibacterium aquaticum]
MEGNRPGLTAIVAHPIGMNETERDREVDALRADIAEPHDVMLLATRDAGHPHLMFLGDLDELLASVAASTSRIGVNGGRS